MWIARKLGKQVNKKKLPDNRHGGENRPNNLTRNLSSYNRNVDQTVELLQEWLPLRPAREELVERGILDRGETFKKAHDELEVFFLGKLHLLKQQDDEAPYGTTTYSAPILELLQSTSDLKELIRQRGECEEQVKAKKQRVEGEREKVQSFVSESLPQLLEMGTSTGKLVEQLVLDEKDLKDLIAKVEPPMDRAREKIRRKQCLQATYDMLEKTDMLRLEVFRAKLPWDLIEELPPLCRKLPAGSLRDTSFQRVRFLISPLRDQLTPKLLQSLENVWPIQNGNKQVLEKPDEPEYQQVMKYIDELLRLQKVHDVVEETLGERWIFEILSKKIIEQYRFHFCRKDSSTCRVDKPEWAFKYIWQTLEDHTQALTTWAAASDFAHVKDIDYGHGLAHCLAAEVRDSLRDRWPSLIPPKASDCGLFLHTLYYLLELGKDWKGLYPRSVTVLTEDLEVSEESRYRHLSEMDEFGRTGFADIFGGGSKQQPMTLFDVWVTEDWNALETQFDELVKKGPAWEPSVEEDYPCVFVQTAIDALQQCELRCIMLHVQESKDIYQQRVISTGVQYGTDILLTKWNSMDSPLQNQAQDATLIIQGMMCFSTIKCSRKALRDIEHLLIRMIDKIVEEIVDVLSNMLTPTALGSTDRFFNRYLAPWVQHLRLGLRSEAWNRTARTLLTTLQATLCTHLLNEIQFEVNDQVTVAINNCRDDLLDVLKECEQKGFEKMWEILKILEMTKEQALALRRDPQPKGSLSTLDAMRVLHRRPDLK